MGITRLTAIIIRISETFVKTFQSPDGKYGFIISRVERGNYRTLVSSQPYTNSREAAQNDGENLVKEITDLDLSKI